MFETARMEDLAVLDKRDFKRGPTLAHNSKARQAQRLDALAAVFKRQSYQPLNSQRILNMRRSGSAAPHKS